MSSVKIPVSPVSSLTPLSSALEKLIYFFCYGWDFIIKPKDRTWTTVSRYLLLPRTFERYWHNPKLLLGLRFGNLTRLGCIDLDKHSKYHPWINPQAYRRIIKALKKLGICRTVLIQSSDSGGVHLFFFFSEQINTFNLACGLTKVLIEEKFELGLGQLEIFPNTKRWVDPKKGFSLYNGLRVPLQPGTGAKILDPNTFEPISGGIDEFVEQMIQSSTKQNLKLLNKELATARDWYKEYKKSLGWNYEEQWERDLEVRLEAGFTASGQTNDILRDLANLGRVFRGKDREEKLTEFIETEVVSLPGYREHCGHQQDIHRRSRDWSKSSISFWSEWRSQPQRSENYQQLSQRMELLSGVEPEVERKIFRGKWSKTNQKRHDQTLHKLLVIIKECPVASMPKEVLKRRNFINSRCKSIFGTKFSPRTLSKPEYRKLWHPKFTTKSSLDKSSRKLPLNFRLWAKCYADISRSLLVNIQLQITKLKKQDTAKRQVKNTSNKTVQREITPPSCSTQKINVEGTSKNLNLQCLQTKDHTLMKCFVDSPPQIYRTSVSKLEEINQFRKSGLNSYFYHGKTTSNRTGNKKKFDDIHFLEAGTKIRVTRDIHSSTLSDSSVPILVYVQKIKSNEKVKYLVNLDNLVSVKESSQYAKAVLPEIKQLVISLGFSREDYLAFIRQAFNVANTGQLLHKEIFSLVEYLRYLYTTAIDKNKTIKLGDLFFL